MTTPNRTEPLKVGTVIKIRYSGYHRPKIAEFRGPLGPKGARVYRILVQSKPWHVYIKVLEDQLEVLARIIHHKDTKNTKGNKSSGSKKRLKQPVTGFDATRVVSSFLVFLCGLCAFVVNNWG